MKVELLEENEIINDNVQQIIPGTKESNRIEQIPRAMNLNDIFCKNPLDEAANILKNQQITGHNLKVGLLTVIHNMSPKLNISMCLMLGASDPSVGMNALKQSMMLVPEDAYRECGQLKTEELFGDASGLNGKTLVGLEPSAFTKTWGPLKELLANGYTIQTEVIKSKYNTFTHSHKAESLISMVGIITDMRDSTYNDPAVLKLPLHVDEYPLRHLSGLQNNQQVDLSMEVAMARLRETLARLRPRVVAVPFEDKLFEAIKATNPSNPERKMEIILKILSIVCIINNPEEATKEEIIAKIYGIDIHKLNLLMENQNISGTQATLTATKVDYYYVWLLLNNMLPVKEIALSDRQIKVFEAVKRWNLGRMGNSFGSDNIVKKLSQISSNSANWARRENVFEALNASGIEEISQSTIYIELQYLIKEGLIAEGKFPKSSQKGYHITTFDAGQKIQLPHPSEIIDTVYKGEKVEVINPLTGEIETI